MVEATLALVEGQGIHKVGLADIAIGPSNDKYIVILRFWGHNMESDSGEAVASADPVKQVECPFCAELISERAKKCKHCGETLDVALRRAEEALRASERGSNVYMNAAVASGPQYHRTPKSKTTAVILALLLGGIGAHKFYLEQSGQGIFYLLFCWTFIPAFVAFIEAIIYATTSDEAFHAKYG